MARHDPVRLNQILGPFGPGSIYVGKNARPMAVCGLDRWFYREPGTDKPHLCERPEEFRFGEPRLARLLGVTHFRTPPDLRLLSRNQNPPVNHSLYIPCFRFPRWHVPRGQRGWVRMYRLRQESPDRDLVLQPDGQHNYQRYLTPIRFIVVCEGGHLDDFPWRRWVGCPVTKDGHSSPDEAGHVLEYFEDGSGDLASVRVRCRACKKEESLRGITSFESQAGEGTEEKLLTTLSETLRERGDTWQGGCAGYSVWHDSAHQKACGRPILGTLLSALNVYFPRTVTSILIPEGAQVEHDEFKELIEVIRSDYDFGEYKVQYDEEQPLGPILAYLRTFNQRYDEPKRTRYRVMLTQAGQDFARRVFAAGPGFEGPAADQVVESAGLKYRRVEYNCLLREAVEDDELRTKQEAVPSALQKHVDRVTLVERLRATLALLGFDRIRPRQENPQSGTDTAIDWHRLFIRRPEPKEDWVPGARIYGEGIFLRLNENRINAWIKDRERFLHDRLPEDFVLRFNDGRYLPPLDGLAGEKGRHWVARYLLVHGLAHALINQLVFECGYSSASLRERLYVSADEKAPMAGMLIYTAAGDSEGTLGGLVQQGMNNRLARIFLPGLRRISWCSADPICSEVDYQGVDRTNRAACHSCLLLPETACETINRGLDRSLLIGTPEDRDGGYFSDLASRYLVQS
jgi:hypothetical protein